MSNVNQTLHSFQDVTNVCNVPVLSDGSCGKKELVIKLKRLTDVTVKRYCKNSTDSKDQNVCSKTTREFQCEVERILTKWVQSRAKKEDGELTRSKVIKRAKFIANKLKNRSGNKFKDADFIISKEWFDSYLIRSHVFDTECALDPVLCSFSKHKLKSLLYQKMGGKINMKKKIKKYTSSKRKKSEIIELLRKRRSEIWEESKREVLFDELNFANDTNEQETEMTSNNENNSEAIKVERIDSPLPINDKTDDLSNQEQLLLPMQNNLVVDETTVSALKYEPEESPIENSISPTNSQQSNNVLRNVKIEERASQDDNEMGFPQLQTPTRMSTELRSNFRSLHKTVHNVNNSDVLFKQMLAKILKEEKYCPQQIFNIQEINLYWKVLFSGYVSADDILDGLPCTKDPLAVLLGTNASGDCKIQPLLVYREENPSPMKHIIKSSLPIIWRYNPKAKMTVSIFEDWFTCNFIPTVHLYCAENNIPFKIILLLDNRHCHRRLLEFAHPNVKVIFFPNDVNSSLQPMHQGICDLFKLNYLKEILKIISEGVVQDQFSVESFWKSFNILQALKCIVVAWNEVSTNEIVAAWKEFYSENLPNDNSVQLQSSIQSIMNFASTLQWCICEGDIKTWLDYHNLELDSREIKLLEDQVARDHFDGDLLQTIMNRNKLLKAFKYLDDALKIFESEDPNFKRSSHVVDNIRQSYKCYRKMYEEQKKTILNQSPW